MQTARLVRMMGLVGGVASLTACPTAPPVINPASGSQPCPYTVTITDATQNATIHYTTDNTPVTITSPTYTGPFSLAAWANVNAFATAPPGGGSTVTTASYFCTPTGPTYANIELDITTGSDDARADTQLDAYLTTSLGRAGDYGFHFPLKASGDAAWTAPNPVVKTFALNPPVPVSAILDLSIQLTEHDQFPETDDNWNMQTLRVLLYNQATDKKCVISVSGNPAVRLNAGTTADERPGGC